VNSSFASPSPLRRLLRSALLFALLHWVALLALMGLIFFTSHLPPKAVSLDGLLNVLVGIEDVMVAPRKGLLWLWPFETTPAGFGLLLTVLNSGIWGGALAVARAFWIKATT
jgi:hypothetical protein